MKAVLVLLLVTLLAAAPVQVQADRLELFKRDGRALYQGHAKATRDTLTMTCDTIEVLLGPNDDVTRVIARGNVEAVDGQRRAWGDQADFDNLTGVLVMTGNPRGQEGNREIDGDVFTFTTGDDRLVVANARTRAQEQDGKQLTIDADQLELRSRDQQALWTGNVRARKEKLFLTAPQMTAFYDEKGDVQRVIARGGVEVTEEDRWARGQQGDYDVPNGRLVVTGKPQARQKNTRLKGTRVTFLTGTDFMEVENATTVITSSKAPGATKK